MNTTRTRKLTTMEIRSLDRSSPVKLPQETHPQKLVRLKIEKALAQLDAAEVKVATLEVQTILENKSYKFRLPTLGDLSHLRLPTLGELSRIPRWGSRTLEKTDFLVPTIFSLPGLVSPSADTILSAPNQGIEKRWFAGTTAAFPLQLGSFFLSDQTEWFRDLSKNLKERIYKDNGPDTIIEFPNEKFRQNENLRRNYDAIENLYTTRGSLVVMSGALLAVTYRDALIVFPAASIAGAVALTWRQSKNSYNEIIEWTNLPKTRNLFLANRTAADEQLATQVKIRQPYSRETWRTGLPLLLGAVFVVTTAVLDLGLVKEKNGEYLGPIYDHFKQNLFSSIPVFFPILKQLIRLPVDELERNHADILTRADLLVEEKEKANIAVQTRARGLINKRGW